MRMRKFTSLLTTAVVTGTLMFGIAGTSVFAAPAPTTEQNNAFSFSLDYTIVEGSTAYTYPDGYGNNTWITFSSTPDVENPTDANISVDDVRVYGQTNTVNVDLPAYTQAGVYNYTIKENGANVQVQGESYDTDTEIKIAVLVSFDADNNLQVEDIGVVADENGDKEDTITNTYGVGSLAVGKEVTGNMGDKEAPFNINVTFRSQSGKAVRGNIYYERDGGEYVIFPSRWRDGQVTEQLLLKHGESITFRNIPEGVTYQVSELEADMDGYETSYTVTGDYYIEAGDTEEFKITNRKQTTISTGINTTNLPYIIVFAGIAGVVVITVVRRRVIKSL